MSGITRDSLHSTAGRYGSWPRLGQASTGRVLPDHTRYGGEGRITSVEDAYKHHMTEDNTLCHAEDNNTACEAEDNMVKVEVSSSSDDEDESEEEEEDDLEEEGDNDEDYPEEPAEEETNYMNDQVTLADSRPAAKFLESHGTAVITESTQDDHPSQCAEESFQTAPKIDNVKTNEPNEISNGKPNDNIQRQEEASFVRVPHSSEQIPMRHRTLKMRLKLNRTPIIVQNDDREEEVHVPGKRKRGRPPLQIKKEPKKFMQVSLGNQADRWQQVKNLAGGLKFHSQVAKILLDCFDAILDGSLQWSSQPTNLDLKARLQKMLSDSNLALPKDSWLKGKKKSSVALSPPKQIVYKEDSQEDMEDTDNFDEFPDHSTDEDYLPEKDIHRPVKRSQPKRRKQSTPRRVVVGTTSNQATNKKVKPLKVTLTRDCRTKNDGNLQRINFLTVVKKEQKGKRGRRRSADSRLKSPSPQKLTIIPPEFASYPKVFRCRRCPVKSEEIYHTFDLLKEHYDTHKLDDVLPKKKYAPNLPPLSPEGEETEEAAIQRMAKVLICCPDCKKLFFPGRLVQHLRTAHVRVLCEECGGMFSRVAMWEHKKAHKFKAEGKKPYKCDKCNKEFLWQVSLRQHRELHSKERPFICSACGKSFKTLTKMKRHEIIHEAVKPYICPHCRRSFTQRTNLKTHIRTHTGEKPYKCEYCAKHFTHKVSMKTHMKKEHGVDMWRDGPPHRVQEFDDVRCQMKRRKNPLTKSIQNVAIPDPKVEIPAVVTEEPADCNSMPKILIEEHIRKVVTENHEDLHQDHLGFRGEAREYLGQRELMGDHRRFKEMHSPMEEHRPIEEDGRQIGGDHRVLSQDPRSHVVAGSPNEMVEIPVTNRQHVKPCEDPHDIEHHNSEHQMQNCISPVQGQCDAVQVSLVDDPPQQQHEMHRSHESMHYTPHYLPASTDMSLIAQHMPSNTSHNHSVSRYSSGQDTSTSRYPHMPAMHPDIRQGSLHPHELQPGATMHHAATHPRYPAWPPSHAGGPQGYIPGEMGPAILNELMKLGK